MQIERTHSWKKVGVQCLLLALPTLFFAFFVLHKLNGAYEILQNQWIYQGISFSLGILISLVFYGWRFRVITTSFLLVLLYFVGYKILKKISIGEFDMFFFSIQYLIFVFIFSVGWLVGFGFSRWRFFTVAWIMVLLAIEIMLVSKVQTVSASDILLTFVPVLLYAFYIIYSAELIRNLNEHQSSFSWFLIKRIRGFFIIAIVIFTVFILLFKNDLMSIEREWKTVQPNYKENKSNSESLTKTNHDGTLSTANNMPLGGSLNKTKQLLFVAKLNNFFADGKTENPLYFTADYYTLFDSVKQAFETDSLMPFNDLFKPDPSGIPLFYTKTDSLAIKNAQSFEDRNVVDAEIYKVALSPSDFIAPSTAFAIQPITIPREYTNQYTSAYRAKMWVSTLNSAYFIYNPAGNTMLEDFQNTRFNLLRKDTSYAGIDSSFLQYYTAMPSGKAYQEIDTLAQQIIQTDSAQKLTTIDKMLAIRNYFLSNDEFGQPLFKYTDNPGVPGLPNANKLSYFLFENRKGYCAYFAGATLFLLRSLHIPSRIATGFLTVDRSSKNPGWYWFYEDQAHAWVQVFFPKYGWIDFDTTIPDLNTQQAPQPDGTPPLGSQQVYFVADGIVQKISTKNKQLTLATRSILYKDVRYKTASQNNIVLNINYARVSSDTGVVDILKLKEGMHISAASYDANLNKATIRKSSDTADLILSQLKKPIVIDEIKIIEQKEVINKSTHIDYSFLKSANWTKVLVCFAFTLLGFALLIIFSPFIILFYYKIRAEKGIYWKYRASLFYLNQLGYSRRNLSPEEFAQTIDHKFNTNFGAFTKVYQKRKYSKKILSQEEQNIITNFTPEFFDKIKMKVPKKERITRFFNFYDTLYFFSKN